MPIGIYTAADPSTGLSHDHSFSNALLVSLDGKLGGIIQKKLYIRNSDNTLWYSGTTLTPVDLIDPTVINNTRGFSWKLSVGNTQPLDDQWAAILPGNTITFSDLGSLHVSDTSTYLPFWIRVQIPRNTSIQSILDVTLNINTNENLVT